jgi:hypothetical protein
MRSAINSPRYEALEGLREGRIRDVSLVLVELAGGKKAPGRDERFMEFIDHGGLPTPE